MSGCHVSRAKLPLKRSTYKHCNSNKSTHNLTDAKHLLKHTKFNEMVKKAEINSITLCHIKSFMKSYEDQN